MRDICIMLKRGFLRPARAALATPSGPDSSGVAAPNVMNIRVCVWSMMHIRVCMGWGDINRPTPRLRHNVDVRMADQHVVLHKLVPDADRDGIKLSCEQLRC